MKTTWEYSAETEALRLLHCARQTAVGFYKVNGFIVLPDPATVSNIVCMPDVPYLSIPRFWEQVKRINVETLPIKAPTSLIKQTVQLLEAVELPKPNFARVQKAWEENQEQILKTIFELIPDKKGKVSEIIIMPTSIGTSCSFNSHKKSGDPIIIWIREDRGIDAIVEAILTSLTRQDVYDQLGGLWSESEIIVDWLVTFSPLSKFIPKANKTIKSTRAVQNASLIQQSDNYMRKIGAPVVSVNQIKTDFFSPRELEIFQLLLSRSPALVTMDEIGDLIFKNPDEFSLFAISKSIQRLRDKLEKNGISGSYIQTKRGEGYLLMN